MPISANIRRRPVYLCLDVGLEAMGQQEVMTSEGLPELSRKCRFLNKSKGVIRGLGHLDGDPGSFAGVDLDIG
jgi:hypothetical protein